MYLGIIKAGWKTGVHDCRGLTYQHPWLAVCRETGRVVGCWSRSEARRVLQEITREATCIAHVGAGNLADQ